MAPSKRCSIASRSFALCDSIAPSARRRPMSAWFKILPRAYLIGREIEENIRREELRNSTFLNSHA